MKLAFVWLGSRRARRQGVAEKGWLLDHAAAAGLPVPAGAILLDQFFHLLLKEDVIAFKEGRVLVPEPALLSDTLYTGARLPRFKGTVALRAASTAEQRQRERTHRATCRLAVDANDPAALAGALAEVWSAAIGETHDEGATRRDILLMEMVDAEVSGRAVTQPASPGDSASYWDSTGEGQLRLPRLKAWRLPDSSLPPFAQRLQRLLRGARRTFGMRPLAIEWLDDGRICWLSQVHLLRERTERSELQRE